MIDRNFVKFLKEQYPKGTRIRLNSMSDPYAPVEPGTEGSVEMVDDAGQLLMKWDNGRTLALIPGEDSFSVLPPKLTTLKLYMPKPHQDENIYGADRALRGKTLLRRWRAALPLPEIHPGGLCHPQADALPP